MAKKASVAHAMSIGQPLSSIVNVRLIRGIRPFSRNAVDFDGTIDIAAFVQILGPPRKVGVKMTIVVCARKQTR